MCTIFLFLWYNFVWRKDESIFCALAAEQIPITSELLQVEDAGNEPGIPGGRLNKKDGLTRYGDSHVKDKTS